MGGGTAGAAADAPEQMIRALLFDLDGTMIDSDPHHLAVFSELFAERGREIDGAFFAEHLQGRLNADIFGEFFPDEDTAALAEEKEARFRDRLGARAEPMPGLLPLLDRAHAAGWRTGVVTNAPRANVEVMLAALGIAERFDAVVVADDLPRGKPDPLPYLTGLERLGAEAGQALAFEDSRSGVAAAAAAGLTTLALRSSLGHDALVSAGASGSIADFTDPGLGPWLDRLTEETP